MSGLRGLLSVGCAVRGQARYASHLQKKRSSMDPEVAKMREHRKRSNLERDIREMLKHSKNLKPVEEMVLPIGVQRRLSEHARPPTDVPFAEAERRALLTKRWTAFVASESRREAGQVKSLLASRAKALAELRKVDEALYHAAIQPDETLLPLELSGPAATPPIPGYESPDGDFVDTTRVFDYVMALDKGQQKAKWEARKREEIFLSRAKDKKAKKKA